MYPDSTNDILDAINNLNSDIVTAIGSINLYDSETVNRTIYVEITGSDITGDGSIGNPFATIGKAINTIKKYINSNVEITVQLGIGTFTFSVNDLSAYATIKGAGTVIFLGTMVLVDSGFTMGATLPNDPVCYNVSGGNTATWTLNQWQYYFLKSGSSYYPITHNDLTPTLSICQNITGSEIYQTQTIVNLEGNIMNYCNKLEFNNLKIYITDNITFSGYDIIVSECFLEGTGKQLTNDCSEKAGSFNRIAVKDIRFNLAANNISFGGYINYNIAGTLISCLPTSQVNTINQVVLENPNANGRGIWVYDCILQGTASAAATVYTKFINCTVGFIYQSRVPNIKKFTRLSNEKIILVNCSYMFRMYPTSVSGDYDPVKIPLVYANIYGAPTVRWFYDQMYEFVNVQTGRDLRIIGLIYPEFEQDNTVTLTDNATTNVIIGNKLQNRSMLINYTISRGTTYETSRIKVIHDGTLLYIAEDAFTGTDCGVTFAVAFSGNDIQLQCTLTSTGSNAEMKFNIRRTIISPLTI